jgi:signal transduction histidine kinase/CheY-like chemotaxis protein
VELFRGSPGDTIVDNDRQVIEGRVAKFRGEQMLHHKDGHEVYLDLYKTALRDDHGEISGLFGIAVDVTERKAAERREELALSRLRGAIESHPAMFMLFDDRERLVLWSSRASEQFRELEGRLAEGTTYEEIARLTAARYVDEDELDAYLVERLAEFRSGNAQGTRLRKDGRWIQFYDHRTEDGGTVSLRYDVTDLKTRELELQQAHKMEAVGQLTGGVAHDFNNLLTVMLGNVELLKRYVAPVGKPIQLIERTIAAGERGAALTQRLLSFSRRQTLQPRPTDLNALVQGLHDLLQRAVGESVQMQVRLHAGLWAVHTDPAQLENALLNLVLNARDAMPTGGTLTIETDNALLDGAYARSHNVRAGEYAALSVSDTGVGVPADVIERVFDPFFTTKEIGKGSGLGLSMVYGFIQQSSGHVRLFTEEGRGTTVCLYLPRTEQAAVAPGRAVAGAETPRGNGALVLIVEDDPHIAMLAKEMLTGIGYRTHIALNAADAFAHIEREPNVQVLFSDVVLPGGRSGIELAEASRRLRPALKVLFTTGYAEHEQLSSSLQSLGAMLLVKPYRRTELAFKLQQLLGAAPSPTG